MPLALIAIALAAPAGAQAADVRVVVTMPPCTGTQSKYMLCEPPLATAHYEAAPGERNALTVFRAGREVRFRDEGAPVRAGSGCAQEAPDAVVCTAPERVSMPWAQVDLGDGDDAVTGADEAFGGPGDDRITGAGFADGGPGADVVLGTPRDDNLIGGPGRDELRGDAGFDALVPDGADAERDVVDGGEGLDRVSYATRRTGVDLALAEHRADGDALSGIENATGSRAADVLRGDDGPNDLDAGAGADVLDGAGGGDQLNGSRGDDLVDGGAGDDVLLAERGSDRFRCGDGIDRVTGAERIDTFLAPCERIELAPPRRAIIDGRIPRFTLPPVTRATDPVAILRGDHHCFTPHCRLAMRLTAFEQVLAATRLTVRRRHTIGPSPLRLSRAGRRLLRRTGAITLSLRVDGPHGRGSTGGFRFVARLEP